MNDWHTASITIERLEKLINTLEKRVKVLEGMLFNDGK